MAKLNLKKAIILIIILTFVLYYLNEKIILIDPKYNIWKYGIVSSIIFLIVYGLHILYEKYLWKYWVFKKIFIQLGFQEYPKIDGSWTMKCWSSYKFNWDTEEYETKVIGKDIVIKKIINGFSFSGDFDKSGFESTFSFLKQDKNNKKNWMIGYHYKNNPEDPKMIPTGFVEHNGFAVLFFNEDKESVITGFYGNDENRKTRGKIVLNKN
ncbi:MAG: hypothetical protein KAT32_00345 [Candidatus Moranbacteria bacterium]|nr:hypothetical protein [Candidatus Moranbacteria bacterium]